MVSSSSSNLSTSDSKLLGNRSREAAAALRATVLAATYVGSDDFESVVSGHMLCLLCGYAMVGCAQSAT
jgi:hypothetical protein